MDLNGDLNGDLGGDSGGRLRYVAIDMQTLDGSDPRLRWGSPTILLDGRDLFGQEPAAKPSLMCRMYPEGLPSKTEIAERLDARESGPFVK